MIPSPFPCVLCKRTKSRERTDQVSIPKSHDPTPMYNIVDMEESFVGSPIWAVVDTVSNQPSDGEEEEEALSFCNLAIYAANDDACLQDPKNKSLESTEDFEFASFGSHVRPAEDLFYKGQLLPLHNRPESDLSFRKSSSCKEMRAEKVKAWRMNSLDSQINYWSSSGSIPHRQHERAHHFDSSPSKHKIKSKPPTRSTASAPSKAQKSLSASSSSSSSSSSSLKWQFFTLGLMKTPQMKLEDIRQRQGRPSISDKIEPCPSPAVLKRSVSCIHDDSQPSFGKAKATNTERHMHKLKSRSVKENMARSVEAEKPSSSSGKGWKMLKPLTALNGCRASTSSVINCSTKRSSSSLPHDGFNNHNLPFTARMHGLAQGEAHFKVSA